MPGRRLHIFHALQLLCLTIIPDSLLLAKKSQHLLNSFVQDRSSPVTCSVIQLCLTLWDPLDCSLPGSSVHGIFHGQEYSSMARILEQIAISSSRGSSRPRDQTLSPVSPCATWKAFICDRSLVTAWINQWTNTWINESTTTGLGHHQMEADWGVDCQKAC